MNVATISEPKIVNTAVMQIWQWCKENGHEVEHYSPLRRYEYDRIYASFLFDYTPRYYVPPEAIKGGTGFDVASRLPPDIEACGYDYSAYPKCDYSIVWFSRGCIRACPFCVVRKKEGGIQSAEPKNLNPNGRYIKVQDNNFFANPKWREAIQQLKDWGQPVEFEGVDARLMTPEMCQALHPDLKLTRHPIRAAWDDPRVDLSDKFEKIISYIPAHKISVYVLIGYNSTPEEDLMRVEVLRDMGISPFVMPYNKRDPYQRSFARWVNRKQIFNTVEWKDYNKQAVPA